MFVKVGLRACTALDHLPFPIFLSAVFVGYTSKSDTLSHVSPILRAA